MTEIPYYLRDNISPAVPGQVDIFNYDNLSATKYGYEPTSIWENLGESVDRAGDYVWDSVAGAWSSVKSGIETEISEKYSFLKWELVFWIGIALVIIFVIGKTGLLGDVAKILTLKG